VPVRFYTFEQDGVTGLAAEIGAGQVRGLPATDPAFPGPLTELLRGGGALTRAHRQLRGAPAIDLDAVTLLPPVPRPGKVICAGLNYAAHTAESRYQQPDFPTLFVRAASSLTGHGQPIVKPGSSNKLDYEGELAAVIGLPGRHISRDDAHAHIAGYSVFNDGTVRDYAAKTTQWTPGKNFDDTGAFGPCFVTADALPDGAAGLRIRTVLNGSVVQDASTADMIWDVADLVVIISSVMTLEAGDVLVTGTPSGVGASRKPPSFMQHGDVCEVEIEGIGRLRNPIVAEAACR
jgi:acylpyruvate hydrolase